MYESINHAQKIEDTINIAADNHRILTVSHGEFREMPILSNGPGWIECAGPNGTRILLQAAALPVCQFHFD